MPNIEPSINPFPKPQPVIAVSAVKVDDNTIEVTKQAPIPDPVVQKYDYNFLLTQRDAIQAQKDAFDAARDDELAEVNDLIAQADALGVVATPAVAIDIKPEE